ncbi:MAG: hypothetical protein FWF34_01165 [Alphaproteobacteria bacterium]|nr:hypothetical protein [Alphaproteobacteria bacterium]MCL2889851.1 hypothetical protein [Alphaproteobacteria bacterium]
MKFIRVAFIAFSAGFALCAGAFAAQSPINSPTPVIAGGVGGGNLTAFSGNVGAMNNQQWNTAMNPGNRGAAPAANFGNCNAVILRCAQPRCTGGGCADMNVAAGIVNGCVQSSAECRQYGDDLVFAIAAQLVAQSTAQQNQMQMQMAAQAAAADQAGAAAAAEQQMQQMQMQMAMQMQQLQNQMAAQAEESDARMASILEQQRAAAAQPAVVAASNEPSAAAMTAAATGINIDVLVREQASGQILAKLDDVKANLREARAAMDAAFEYAGCDRNGNNCTGPRRVAAFRAKAFRFFDPYNDVLDNVYDALIQAQTLGVDITDIYMMLNDSCNVWGQFLCSEHQILRFMHCTCDNPNCRPGNNERCAPTPDLISKVIPPNQGGCTLLRTMANSDTIQQNWIWPEQNIGNQPCTMAQLRSENCIPTQWDAQGNPTGGYTRGDGRGSRMEVACASDVLNSASLLRNRRRQSVVGIEDLELVLGTDYNPVTNPQTNQMVCHGGFRGGDVNRTSIGTLQNLVNAKRNTIRHSDLEERQLTSQASASYNRCEFNQRTNICTCTDLGNQVRTITNSNRAECETMQTRELGFITPQVQNSSNHQASYNRCEWHSIRRSCTCYPVSGPSRSLMDISEQDCKDMQFKQLN